MSAVVGLIDWRGGPAGPTVRKALDALALHGRDGEGFWDGGDVALGWRQTILHAEDMADHQPLVGGEGRFRLVFDGRIDNRDDLAHGLNLHPEQARSLPDSAYVLAAFEAWGKDCVRRLLGDFAFALWDSQARDLFLARDTMGRRPLFYQQGDGVVFFASMPSALFTRSGTPRELDEDSLILDLCLRRIPPSKTFYRGIQRVPAAHSLSVRADGQQLDHYWWIEDAPDIRFAKDDDYVSAFREQFDAAVRCRLRTIHPIGAHLSSGWDSSSVTATTARLLSPARLTAFTHTPPLGWRPDHEIVGQIYDEGPLAAQVADRLPNVDHRLIRSSGQWDFQALDDYARFFERPRWDVHNAGWFDDLHRQARAEGVRVMLMGGDGNFTISAPGYDRLTTLFRRGRLLSLAKEWQGLRRVGRSWKSLTGATLGPFVPDEIWDLVMRALGRPSARSLVLNFINPAVADEQGVDWRTRDGDLGRSNMHRADRRTILAYRSQTDRSALHAGSLAAWDLELRDPTGDRRMWAFAYGVPDDQLLRNGQTKWLLRRAMTGVLPNSLLNERARGRQAADWYKTAGQARPQLVEEIGRLKRSPVAARLLDVDGMEIEAEGEARGGFKPSRRSEFLIRGVALGRYMRRFQDGGAD